MTLKREGMADGEVRRLSDGDGHSNVRFNRGELPLRLPPHGAAIYDLTPP